MHPCNYIWMITPHILINNLTFLIQKLTKTCNAVMDIQLLSENNLITWVSKTIWKMFYSEFPQALVINPCARKTICYYFKLTFVSVYTCQVSVNDKQQEHYGFSSSCFKKSPIVIYDITKIKLTKLKINPLLNIDEQQFINPIFYG